MSWLFSQALVVDCLHRTCSDGVQPALSNWIGTADAFLHSDKMTDSCSPLSLFGMTFVPLTACRGAGVLMSCLEDFLVRLIAKPLRGKTLQTISGRKCNGSWQMSLPGTFLPRTLINQQSTQRATISNRWVTKPRQFPLERKTWVATTFGNGIGFLHTPTTKANYCADSMQKWPSARAFRTVFGRPSPENHEWMMGWPIGWSAISPLEMDGFQSWQSRHCGFFAVSDSK